MGTRNGIVYSDGFDFSGTNAATGNTMTTNGQLLIGNTGGLPVIGTLTQPASGLTITNGAGSITFALADDIAAIEAIATTGVVSRTGASAWATSSVTQNAMLYGGAGETLTSLAVATNGQIPVGSTGAAPVLATITAGAGITVTNAAGSITIASIGGYFTWSNVGASGALLVNQGFNCTAGAALSFSLPAVSAVGDVIRIVLDGSTSWTITQGAGQQIRFGALQTTAGAGGSLASSAQGDAIEMICKTADTIWTVVSAIGNITVV